MYNEAVSQHPLLQKREPSVEDKNENDEDKA